MVRGHIPDGKYKYVLSIKQRDELKDKDKNVTYSFYSDELTMAVTDVCQRLDKHNIRIGIGTWFVILGQYFDDLVEIRRNVGNVPLRFSLFIIQDSRSGKNTNVNIVRKIANKIGISNISPTSFTEKAIIGLPDTNAIEFNKTLKGKIAKEPEKYDESMYREEFNKGLMEKYQLLIVEEAKNLFKGGHKDNLILYIQEILDDKGEVNVSTGTAGDFTRPATCSFIMTTIPLEQQNVENIVDDGFFQRFALIKRNIGETEFRERHKMYVNAYTDALDFGEKELDEWSTEIAGILKKIKNDLMNHINNMPDDSPNLKKYFDPETGQDKRKLIVQLSDNAKYEIDKYVDMYVDKIEKLLFGDVTKKINSFVNMLVTLYVKMGAISMILKKNKNYTIEPFDIIYAHQTLVNSTYNSMLDLIAHLGKKTNDANIRFARHIGVEWIDKDYVIKKVSSFGKMNLLMALHKIKELTDKKYIEEVENKDTGVMMYRCSKRVWEVTLGDEDLEKYTKNTSKPYKYMKDDDVRQLYMVFYLKHLETIGESYETINFKYINRVLYLNDDNYINIISKMRRNEILPRDKEFRLINKPEDFKIEKDEEIDSMINYIHRMIRIERILDEHEKDYKKDGFDKIVIEMKLDEIKRHMIIEENIDIPKKLKKIWIKDKKIKQKEIDEMNKFWTQ